MSDDGSVLPQGDIDALFKKATGLDIVSTPKAGPPAAASVAAPAAIIDAPPPPTPQAAPSPEPPPKAAPVATPAAVPAIIDNAHQAPAPLPANDGGLKTLQATVTDLAQRIAKIETSISQLIQKERETTGTSVPVKRLSKRLETVVKDLQKVNSRVVRITRGLDGTPGYGVRGDFTCEACGSRGTVAIPARCTNCGREGWWGWWPKKK